MKSRLYLLILLLLIFPQHLFAVNAGIVSLNIKEILKLYNGPIEQLREFESAPNKEGITDNRLRINFLTRHICALKDELENDLSDHLKSIYKDSIIILYAELDKLQSDIITENIKSINEISEYLAQIRLKKQRQDETLDFIGDRVTSIRNIMDELSTTFDSYDQIIEKQNELIDEALQLSPKAYENTVFMAPGLEAGIDLTPYISLGLGYITAADRLSYGFMLEAGYAPTQELVNVSFSVLLGLYFN
ncbi:MAG: hypothetical protein PQJ61_00410 [Spirochaetales bacterium]|uniref:Uncharacterized protein n=1 Tax=Candidatus Thalassospirochaeta sargassi TaxID=3119039 RepID=A0AAJ1I9K5_9SPIO|nr:hypothetical protein [Spirochaetales bacterium]